MCWWWPFGGGKKTAVEGEQLLGRERTTKYRGIAACANYLAADRPDIMFASKECSRRMAAPRNGAVRATIRPETR